MEVYNASDPHPGKVLSETPHLAELTLYALAFN